MCLVLWQKTVFFSVKMKRICD